MPFKNRDVLHISAIDVVFQANLVAAVDIAVRMIRHNAPDGQCISDGPGDAQDPSAALRRLGAQRDAARVGPDRFDSIVTLAREAFHADVAFVAVLGPERTWSVIRSDSSAGELAVPEQLYVLVLAARHELVVRDTRDDERMTAEISDPRTATRFFAGFPIELGGSRARVGVFGVADSRPKRRASDEVDVVLLRELAMLAQRELDRPVS